MMTRTTRITILMSILLLGFGLRLYQLDAAAFRGDEAFSVQRWTAIPLSESLSAIASLEPHPPLTYAIFRIWGIIFRVESEFALRILPVLINLLGIPAIYALGKRLSNQASVGLIAAFFWAIHPFQIWHAQDFRNYGIWAGLSVIVLWLAVRLIHSNETKRIDWILYSSVATFSCLIFYNELITIGVLGLYVLLLGKSNPKFAVRWSMLNGGIIVLTIAVFFVFQGDLISSGDYAGTTGAFQVEQWWQRFIPVLQFGDTLSLSLRELDNPTINWWLFIVIITVMMMAYVALSSPKHSLFVLMLALIPLLVLGLISTELYIFRPRYVLLAVPAYILITSYTIHLLWRKHLTKIIAIALLILWIAMCGISLNNYYHDPAYAKSPDWRELIDYLEANTQEGEIILQTGVDAAFGYYYDKSDIAAGESALPANFDQPIDSVIGEMQQVTSRFDTIWIVGQTFPDWQNAGVVEDWAFENLQLIRDTQIADLPVRQFMNWDVHADEIGTDSLANFAGFIELMGVTISQSTITDEITVIVYWRPLEQTETSLTVFMQLVGDINPETGTPIWSQNDHPPQSGRVSTDLWQTNVIYRDVYTLPLDDVARGEYSLLIGFYDPISNERLVLGDSTDAYIVDSIVIE